jgi:hypothetical protein
MRGSPKAIARDLRRFERIAIEQAGLCRLRSIPGHGWKLPC